jgi:hypothetical protein
MIAGKRRMRAQSRSELRRKVQVVVERKYVSALMHVEPRSSLLSPPEACRRLNKTLPLESTDAPLILILTFTLIPPRTRRFLPVHVVDTPPQQAPTAHATTPATSLASIQQREALHPGVSTVAWLPWGVLSPTTF